MEKYKFDVVSQTLTVTANFADKMNDPSSDEYKLVVRFQSDLCNPVPSVERGSLVCSNKGRRNRLSK